MRVLAVLFFFLGMLGSLGVVDELRGGRETLLTAITLCLAFFTYSELARRAFLAPPTGRLVRGTGYLMVTLGVFLLASTVEDVLFAAEPPEKVFYGMAFALLFGGPGALLIRLGWRNAELEDELDELQSDREAGDRPPADQSPKTGDWTSRRTEP